MNTYFREIPEELLYIILSYSSVQDIERLSKTFKLYIDYEQLCMWSIPEPYSAIKHKLYKYYEEPNYYLIYRAYNDIEIIKIDTSVLYTDCTDYAVRSACLSYSNLHGLNYYCLYKIYKYFTHMLEIIDKFPKCKYSYLYIVFWSEHLKKFDFIKRDNDFIYLYTVYICVLTGKKFSISNNILVKACLEYLDSIKIAQIQEEHIYQKMIISDLIKRII